MENGVHTNLDIVIEDHMISLSKEGDIVGLRYLITLYNANAEYENSMKWIRSKSLCNHDKDVMLCRLFIFSKMVPNSINQCLKTAKEAYQTLKPNTEQIFYMASMYFDAGQYQNALIETGKCSANDMGIFVYQLKKLTFEIMWKQERVHTWIYLMTEGPMCGHTLYLRGVHFMRLCEYERAIDIFEHYIVETYGFYSLKNTYDAYNLLLKCYEYYDQEFPITDADPDARFRLCAHCHVHIDRRPLLEKDTDFLICSQCKRIAFCSEKCNDDHWAVHREECGKHLDSKHRINFTSSISCGYCFRDNAEKQCTRCHKARYCNVECQKKHWKVHKESCK